MSASFNSDIGTAFTATNTELDETKGTPEFCENCGNKLNPKAKFCSKCGTPRA